MTIPFSQIAYFLPLIVEVELEGAETKNHNRLKSVHIPWFVHFLELLLSLRQSQLQVSITVYPSYPLALQLFYKCETSEAKYNSITMLQFSFQSVNLRAHFLCLGDNILAVLKYLVMSEKLADSSEYRHGNMVFFDLLGVVVVAYPARVGTILNYMVATATFLYLAKKASLPGNGGRSPFPLNVCSVLSLLDMCIV